MVKDYIRKYERVQAIQWTGLNASEVSEFRGHGLLEIKNVDYNVLIKIPTVEENHYARIGDWIMKNENSEYWVIDNEVFNEIYEEPELCECVPANDDWKKNRSFSTALDWLKRGEKISRKGWNGKNMFVVYQKGYPDGIPCNKNTAEAWGMKEGELFKCEPYLQIKMVNGSHAMWVPSINDVLSNDWEIYE